MNDEHAQRISAHIIALFGAADREDGPAYIEQRQRISAELLALLPAESDGWDATWNQIASGLFTAVADQGPEVWARVVEQLSTLFRTLEVDPADPRAAIAGGNAREDSGGAKSESIPTRLAERVLRHIFDKANTNQRTEFIRSLEYWAALEALIFELPNLALTEEELSVFLAVVDFKTRGAIVVGDALGNLEQWLTQHSDLARRLVDSWCNNVEFARGLEKDSILLLVQAAVAGDAKLASWRDALVNKLDESDSPDRWEFATRLAFFAQPLPGHNLVAEKRYQDLRRRVRRLPDRLTTVALTILFEDAWEHPDSALSFALELLEGAPEFARQDQGEIWSGLASVFHCAIRSPKANDSTIRRALDNLQFLLRVPPGRAHLDLDLVLSRLATSEPAEVETFLATWLTSHAQSIYQERPWLLDLLPLTSDRLGDSRMRAFLTRGLASKDGTTRFVSNCLVSAQRGEFGSDPLSDEALVALPASDCLALVHDMVGMAIVPAEAWIGYLCRVAEIRTELRSEIVSILQSVGIPNYPGVVRGKIDHWLSQQTDPPPGQDPVSGPSLYSIACELIREIDELNAFHERKLALPELTTTTPSFVLFGELERESIVRVLNTARTSGRFALLSTIPQVPIARGSEGHFGGEAEQRFKMGCHEHRFHLPIGEAYDPLGQKIVRIGHRWEANRLFQNCDTGADA